MQRRSGRLGKHFWAPANNSHNRVAHFPADPLVDGRVGIFESEQSSDTADDRALLVVRGRGLLSLSSEEKGGKRHGDKSMAEQPLCLRWVAEYLTVAA